MKNGVSLETVGLSHREFLTLYWLFELKHAPRYPRSLYLQLRDEFPGKPHGYDYLYKVAELMHEEKLTNLTKEKGKLYYSITPKGEERLRWYQENFGKKLNEVKKVIDRLVFFLTKSGKQESVEEVLAKEYRTYFSKLVSVKDIIRCLALSMGQKRTSFYMSEVDDQLEYLLGWRPSNSYLYHVAREMESSELIVGKWSDDRRTKRYLTVTEEGIYHFKQIADATSERVLQVQHYLGYVLHYLKN